MIREINYHETFDAQRHFRTVLDSMARPGKINQVNDVDISTPDGLNKASAIVAFALLNTDVSFYSSKNQSEINEYLTVNTNSKPNDLEKADFIFINGNDDEMFIYGAKNGVLEYPETSATISVDGENIYDVPKDQTHEIILSGPGVKDEKVVYVSKINNDILKAVMEQNSEYPLGVDIIMTDRNGNILCIPRTNNLRWN